MNFQKRLNDLGYGSYKEYLKSTHWKRFRNEMKTTLRYKCRCGEWRGLHLHHKTYKDIGEEKKKHMIWLCEPCHNETHKLVKSGASLWTADKKLRKTNWFKNRKAEFDRNKPKKKKCAHDGAACTTRKKKKIRLNLSRFTRQELEELLAIVGKQEETSLRKKIVKKIHKSLYL